MTLKDQIESDFIEAYKAKDDAKVSVLRMLKSAIRNTEIAEKQGLDDDRLIKVLKKELKQRQDSAAEYEKAGRLDIAEKEIEETSIIKKYLPKELSEEETLNYVREAIVELNAKEMKDMGKIIALVMQKTEGSADGSKVADLTRKELSKYK